MSFRSYAKSLALNWKLHLPGRFPLPSVHCCLTVLFSPLSFLVRNFYSFYFFVIATVLTLPLASEATVARLLEKCRIQVTGAFKLSTLKRDLMQFRVERTPVQPSNLILWPLFYWASWRDTFSNSLLLVWKKKVGYKSHILAIVHVYSSNKL